EQRPRLGCATPTPTWTGPVSRVLQPWSHRSIEGSPVRRGTYISNSLRLAQNSRCTCQRIEMLPLRIRRQQQQTYDIDPRPSDCFEIDRSVKANQYPEGLAHARQPSMRDSNPPAGSGRSQGFTF